MSQGVGVLTHVSTNRSCNSCTLVPCCTLLLVAVVDIGLLCGQIGRPECLADRKDAPHADQADAAEQNLAGSAAAGAPGSLVNCDGSPMHGDAIVEKAELSGTPGA